MSVERLNKFQIYRDEDKHECNLLMGRVNALLTSQSFLAAAAAIVYQAGHPRESALLIGMIACVAIAVVVIASFGICIGCQVIMAWHQHGNALLAEDKNTGENYLVGYRLDREQVDRRHKISIEYFSICISIVLGIAWLIVFCFTIIPPYEYLLLILLIAILWLVLLRICWLRSELLPARTSALTQPERTGIVVRSGKETMTPGQTDVPPPNLNPLLDLDVYETFRKYLQHENNLTNQRITWMLTILYAAYAFTVQKKLEVAQKINDDVLHKRLTLDSAGHLKLSGYLDNSIYQTEFVILLIACIGLAISGVALRSIRAAGRAGANVRKVFEGQFRVQEAHGVPQTVVTVAGVRLPTVAGGGDPWNITKGFLSAWWIPLFLMLGWFVSIVFEFFLLCRYYPWNP